MERGRGGGVLGDQRRLRQVPGPAWTAGCLCQRWRDQPDGQLGGILDRSLYPQVLLHRMEFVYLGK